MYKYANCPLSILCNVNWWASLKCSDCGAMNTHILYKSKTGSRRRRVCNQITSHFIQNGVSDPERARSARIFYTGCFEHVFLCVWEKTDATHSKVMELLFIERLCNIDALKSILILYWSSESRCAVLRDILQVLFRITPWHFCTWIRSHGNIVAVISAYA